ncbi:MAG TPA: ferredoxin [Deltaproteobacteria bacterium]|nr:ferredoxin [Deltaproteobacteria bacterium]
MDEEGKARVIKPQGGPEDLVEQAIDACPVSCIAFKE